MKEQVQHSNSHMSVATTAMLFGVAGYLAGILSAPDSGRVTRDKISHKTAELKNKAKQTADKIRQQASKKEGNKDENKTSMNDNQMDNIDESVNEM